jgi:RNA polymerase sigma factor for flagellar operon FliA
MTNPPAAAAVLPPDFARRMLPTIRRIAHNLARHLPRHVCIEDLISAGHEGLAEGMSRFDPTRSEGFVAYVERRIRGAMQDELRSRDLLSRDQRRHAREIAVATRAVQLRCGRAATAEEIAAELRIPLETYWQWLSATATDFVAAPREDDAPDAISQLRDPHAELGEDRAARRQMDGAIDEAIRSLPARTQRVLELHFSDGLTLREIGVAFGVSESRVCQIERDALRRVRERCAEHAPDAALAA